MSRMTSARFGPGLALVALALIWGYNWVVMKVALFDAPPLTFTSLRSLLSAVALFAVLLVLRRPLKPVRGWSLVLLGLLQTTGFVGLTALALETGAAGKSAVLAYTMPFWTLLLAGPLLGERMPRSQWPAVLLAAAGLVGILSPWSGTLDVAASLYSLGAAWTWAISSIVAKRMALDGGELLNVSAWQTVYGGVCLTVLAFILDAEPVQFTVGFSIALAYNVVFATALAWLLWLYVLNKLSTAASGLGALAVPVVAFVAAWLQLGELPTRGEAIGMVLILVALAWLAVARPLPLLFKRITAG
jgi:drug/metabolite transporter (DMT)-like permease